MLHTRRPRHGRLRLGPRRPRLCRDPPRLPGLPAPQGGAPRGPWGVRAVRLRQRHAPGRQRVQRGGQGGPGAARGDVLEARVHAGGRDADQGHRHRGLDPPRPRRRPRGGRRRRPPRRPPADGRRGGGVRRPRRPRRGARTGRRRRGDQRRGPCRGRRGGGAAGGLRAVRRRPGRLRVPRAGRGAVRPLGVGAADVLLLQD